MFAERVASLGIAVTNIPGTSPTPLPSIPAGAELALIMAAAGVNWRDDGVAVTPTNGLVLPTAPPYLEYSGDISAMRLCGITNTVGVTVAYFGLRG